MAIQTSDAPHRLRSIAFTTCSNAASAAITASLSAAEETRLRALLHHLQAFGLILPPTFAAAPASFGFQEAVDVVANAVGRHFVHAAFAAGEPSGAGGNPDPVAAMPVWEFVSEGPGADVLLSSARLWGVDLLVEALRVEDDESGEPVPAVRDRHARWLAAAGAGRPVRSIRLPGVPGSFAVFAATAQI